MFGFGLAKKSEPKKEQVSDAEMIKALGILVVLVSDGKMELEKAVACLAERLRDPVMDRIKKERLYLVSNPCTKKK